MAPALTIALRVLLLALVTTYAEYLVNLGIEPIGLVSIIVFFIGSYILPTLISQRFAKPDKTASALQVTFLEMKSMLLSLLIFEIYSIFSKFFGKSDLWKLISMTFGIHIVFILISLIIVILRRKFWKENPST